MSKEIEIEAKNLLTESEFDKIVRAFSLTTDDFITQKNTYFDTSDFLLKQQQSALRIREKNDTYILTLKQPHSIGLLETNQTLTKDEQETFIKFQQLPPGEVVNTLKKAGIAIEDLRLLGTLTTKRAAIPYESGRLFFDISSYLGKVDYEIEFEGNEPLSVNKTFIALLKKHSIPTRETAPKIARFFQAKMD